MFLNRRGRHASVTKLRTSLTALLVSALTASALIGMATEASASTQTFGFTGGPQIYVVPENVTSINVTLKGAEGGNSAGGNGGKGAEVAATIAVNPGEVLMFMVGGNGTVNRGWNGGGRGAGTGGGATDIRREPGAFNTATSCAYNLVCTNTNRIVVAGGGGGSGWAQGAAATANGGDGGQVGLDGSAANLSGGDATAGGGATASAGGIAGAGTFTTSGQGASAGALAQGASSAWVASATGGGGGGGYFGGGSGGVSQNSASTPQADGAGGGGGGSSWAGGVGVTSASFSTGSNAGDGSLIVDPPSAIPTAAFSFTGSEQFYTTPSGTSELFVRMYAAGAAVGATGDIVFGRIPTTGGQVLQVNIGGRGYGDTTNFPGFSPGEGGWNGGGNGHFGTGWGGGSGGGGASDIRACSNASSANLCSLSDRLVVAGGGGGGSYGAWGLSAGAGGSAINGDGGNGANGDFGLGASLTAGGATSGTGLATAGLLGQGGSSGQPFYGAGGGGGGLYGGGGGNGSGGGGGSSCASITAPCNAMTNILGATGAQIGHTRGSGGSTGDGMAVITAMPVAVTGAVSNISSTTAEVAGAINAKFLASTPKLFIDTNQSTIEGCSSVNSTCVAAPTVLRTASLATQLAGSTTQAVAGSISGLSPNSTYFYRVCAQSVAGYSCGQTSTFTTQLSITNTTLANGTVGQSYSDTLIASGGSGSYTSWVLVGANALPDGLSLNAQTGAISGTPSSQGSGSVDVEVTDSLGGTVTKTLAYSIATAPPATISSTPSSASVSSLPRVSGISSHFIAAGTNTPISVSGSNLSNATVTVGGIPVTLTSNSSTSLSFVLPTGLTGVQPIQITTALGTLIWENALEVKITSVAPSSASQVIVFDFFAPGSSLLTRNHHRKLTSIPVRSAGFKTVECTGYTMGPTVLKSDTKLAMLRAKRVCDALSKVAPYLKVTRSTSVTELGVGGKVRRVEVEFGN